jgi:hypothetical protein
MRSLIAAISLSGLALTTGAFAQITPKPPPGAETTPQIPAGPSTSHVEQEHPNWFTEENIPYKPCPSSVVFYPGRRHACLGCPRPCRGQTRPGPP